MPNQFTNTRPHTNAELRENYLTTMYIQQAAAILTLQDSNTFRNITSNTTDRNAVTTTTTQRTQEQTEQQDYNSFFQQLISYSLRDYQNFTIQPITPTEPHTTTTSTHNYKVGDWVEWTLDGSTYKGKVVSVSEAYMDIDWDRDFYNRYNKTRHPVKLSNSNVHKIATSTTKSLVQEKINKLWKESKYVKQNKHLIY